jgi:hypothetical protein
MSACANRLQQTIIGDAGERGGERKNETWERRRENDTYLTELLESEEVVYLCERETREERREGS